jgi:hypothetical protein
MYNFSLQTRTLDRDLLHGLFRMDLRWLYYRWKHGLICGLEKILLVFHYDSLYESCLSTVFVP